MSSKAKSIIILLLLCVLIAVIPLTMSKNKGSEFGGADGEAETADRYRKGPISSTYAMQRELAAMKAENQGLKGEVADLKAENEQMKANIAAMMARLGL